MSSNAKGEIELSTYDTSAAFVFHHIFYSDQTFSFRQLEAMNFTLPLTERINLLEEVVISATKFEERKDDIPRQVQVIDERNISFSNVQTPADMLINTGNIFVQKSQMGGGSPIIRGFEANKVLMVIDGVRMNNAIYRGGHLQNIITIDPNILARTEVVFGPGSTVYGSDALGGVLHFYSKNPQLSQDNSPLFKANAFARYSSANKEKTIHATCNIGFKKLAFLSGITFSDFDDLRAGRHRKEEYGETGLTRLFVERINGKDSVIANANTSLQVSTGYRQYSIFQKALYRQNASLSHIINFQYTNSSDIPRYDRLSETEKNGAPSFSQWYYGPQKRLLASYAAEFSGESLFNKGRVILAYQDIEESRYNRKFRKDNLIANIEKVKVYSLNIDLNKLIGKHELRYGFENSFNYVSSSAYSKNIITSIEANAKTRYPDGGSIMNMSAAYATHSWELSPKFILSDGLRFTYNYLNSLFNDKSFYNFPWERVIQKSKALNGNLGLVYMPGKKWRVAANFSTGFRVPNVDDLAKLYESGSGKVIVPNPNLKPEYTYSSEVSLSKTINDILRLEGVGYYTWVTNVISTKPAQFEGKDSIFFQEKKSQVLSNQNSNRGFITGFSGSVVADVLPALSFSATYNYTYGRIITDSTLYPLDHIAPEFGKVNCIWKVKRAKTEVFVLYNGAKTIKNYNLVGEDNAQYATPNGSLDWITLNLRSSYQMSKNFSLQLSVENIFDTYYRVFASGISAPGRNVVMAVRGNL